MKHQTHLGGCHCGSARFSYSGQGLACFACHCTDCQASTGSAFSNNLVVKREGIELISGATEEKVYLNNGKQIACVYCQTCVTVLWVYFVGDEDYCSIQAGTFDDSEAFKPAAHVWTDSKVSWISLPDSVVSFEKMPPFEELVTIWNDRS